MMKRILLPGIVAMWISLCPQATLSSQQAAREKPSTTTHSGLQLAEKTIDAIRNKDAALLRMLADREGVYIGFDTPKMSAARFRRELAEKRGVYCVLFDISCLKGDFGNSPSVSSLRDVLVAQPVTLRMTTEEMEGASQVVSVDVKKVSDLHETLFTLHFRRVRDHWRLQQIEFW